jgi:AraC-like DNA-binding protein
VNNLIFSIFPNENFVDLGLFQFGREQCKPAHSFGPATRNHFLFHYIISGTGTLYANDSKKDTQTYYLKSNQGFMIFPEQINTYIADENTPWEYVWIEFDGLRVKGMLEMAGLNEDSPIYHARFNELRENMKDEMLYITENSDSSSFHLIGHLYLFLDYLVRSTSGMKVTAGSKLRDFYINETIAEVCGLNRSYFGKIFKKAIGKTPQEFILNFRMTKAAELLKLTNSNIGDIGKAVGYDNSLHFSRAFKNIYGISPKEWRNQNKIN